MKKLQLPSNVTRAFHKVGFQLKKHSPEILIVAGVIGTVTSTVMACKATTKVNSVLENTEKQIARIHEATEQGMIAGVNQEGVYVEEEYTPEDGKKDLAIVYVQTGIEFVKLYGPAVVLGALSLTSMIASNNILRKRNVALAAAYATVDNGFKEYRNRVIERFGKDLDRELKYNIKSETVKETVVDEKGKEKTVEKTINVVDPNLYSPYSIVFDDGNVGWDKDPEKTKFFLVQQQNYANEILKAKGHLFLNEVYEMLGAQLTKAGQSVGWVYDEESPVGDNFVDFGIFDIHKPKACDFVNGYERAIILDFNVDGNILELMF